MHNLLQLSCTHIRIWWSRIGRWLNNFLYNIYINNPNVLTGYTGKMRTCLVFSDVSNTTMGQRLFFTNATYITRKTIGTAGVGQSRRESLFHSLITELTANNFIYFVAQIFIANFIFFVIDGDFKISFIWTNWGWKCYVAN